MYEFLEINKVLVIAPLRVAESTWSAELERWDHLRHLRLSKVLGCEAKRKEALRTQADIYIINRENVPWLVNYYGAAWPFDMLVIDELSSFKSPQAIRFKALRHVRPLIKRVVGLTGTPAPNGLIDLWPQIYLLDRGDRLGKTVTEYRNKYFFPVVTNGAIVYKYGLKAGSGKRIHSKISDICISMASSDYIRLPQRIDNRVDVKLSEPAMRMYETLEREAVLSFKSDMITAVNAAALSTKLLQYANGAVYDMGGGVQEIHNAKIDALAEILDTANGQPVLVFYHYLHDLERIKRHLKSYKPVELKTPDDINEWNAGSIPLMLVHPKSAGHGLNLQAGGHIIVWFGLTWSLEEFQQANARIYRQGQKNAVIIHYLAAKNTIDDDVMKAIENKSVNQDALLDAVKARLLF